MPCIGAVVLTAVFGLALALLYALATQLIFRAGRPSGRLDVMSLGFLLGVPFALGVLAVAVPAEAEPYAAGTALLLPCLACLSLAGPTLGLRWEAPVAVLMALPLCLLAASAGGFLGALLAALDLPGLPHVGLLGLILAGPYLLTLIECRRRPPDAFRGREVAVTIAADRATIWRNIIRVPPIGPAEQHASLFSLVGVPRPREATLSREGLGGIRTGIFDGGITFRETIVEWREHEVLRFDLAVCHAGPARTPLSAIGGPYFDVLEVAYHLEPQGDSWTILRLASRERVTTRFNPYAGLWLDAIMRDFQRSILRVVKARCEC